MTAEERLGGKLHPDSDEQMLRGWALLWSGRPVEAAELFLQTLTTTDLVATTLLNLIVARLMSGDHRQAKGVLLTGSATNSPRCRDPGCGAS